MTPNNTLLIVDDQASVREVLAAKLFKQDYNLCFAGDGYQALEQIEQAPPDLILMDVMMPGMTGFEVCQRLKNDERWKHIPIILITALDDTQALVQGLDAGADEYLSKPVNTQELLARVRSMLRIKTQFDTLQKNQRELKTALHLNQKYAEIFAQHLESLEILYKAGLNLMRSTLVTSSVFELILETALELIPEASGSAMHFVPGQKAKETTSMIYSRSHAVKDHPKLGIEPVVNQVVETGEYFHIPDVTAAPYSLQPNVSDLRSLLITPLLDEQRILGALTVYSAETYTFEEAHQHSLSILAGQAVVAIQKAQFLEAKDLAQEQEKQAVRDLFRRYVNPEVVERLVDGREKLALGGKRQEISVLFADIRGFTTFSENLPPEELVTVLNQYLALAVEAVLAEEGTLDKFMGDAVMAFFNAPVSQPDHTLRAARAALAMKQAIAEYNAQLQNGSCLNFGIGIHLGQAVVGNIGTVKRMDYTAIGDTVNLAKRLQENAKGGQIIISQTAYNTIENRVTAESLGVFNPKGRSQSVVGLELTGLRASSVGRNLTGYPLQGIN